MNDPHTSSRIPREALRGEATSDVLPIAVLPTLQRIERRIDEIHKTLSRRQKPLLTVEEIAEIVGRSPYTVRRWISEGRLSAIRIEGSGPRGRLLVPREQLDELIAGGRGAAISGIAAGAGAVDLPTGG